MLLVPQLAVHGGHHARAAHGIPDGLLDVPHDEPRVDPVDVQPRERDAALPAGFTPHGCRLCEVPSDADELYDRLLPEQRMS